MRKILRRNLFCPILSLLFYVPWEKGWKSAPIKWNRHRFGVKEKTESLPWKISMQKKVYHTKNISPLIPRRKKDEK